MSHDDFDFEPILGLPAKLPPGETLLWQGTPRWESLAVRAYHVRKVAVYFALIVLCRIVVGISSHHSAAAIVGSCVFLLVLGGIAIGVLSLLAFLNAGSTVYTITSRRLLLRHGVAVPLTLNIPFRLIEAADLRSFADGTGDISVRIAREQRVGYLITWPHLRSGQFTRPAPCFRSLMDAASAARLLSAALLAECNAAQVSATSQASGRDNGQAGEARMARPARTAAA